jgi:hypothetical protein
MEYIKVITEKNLRTIQNLSLYTQNLSSESFRNINVSNIQLTIHIKSIDLSMQPLDDVFHTPSDEFMTYLMIKFPNLNSINLDISNVIGLRLLFPSNFDDTTQSISITIQFLVYLFEIPCSFLECTINEDRRTSLRQQLQLIKFIGHFFETMLSKNTLEGDMISIMNCVAKYCKRLKNLIISCDKFYFYDEPFVYTEEPSLKTSNVKKLVLSTHMPSPELIRYASDHLLNLETVVLKYGVLMENHMYSLVSFNLANATLKKWEVEISKDTFIGDRKIKAFYIKKCTLIKKFADN